MARTDLEVAPTDRHLLLAFDGLEPPADLRDRLATGAPPGVSLFRHRNVADAAQVRALTTALQAARDQREPPLLIAADQEGGQFLALGDATTPFAGNLALGAVGDPELVRRVGTAMARESRALGVNVVYGPVCDLLTDPANPSLGLRSFGDDPAAVAELAAAMIRGLEDGGVAATLKHFPGGGAIASDPHHELGTLAASREVLDTRELRAVRGALRAKPSLVMSAHVAVPALTGRRDLPATLARSIMTGLLRDELGFEGVSITDALDMAALAQGAGQVIDAAAALRAGVDLLLCAPDAEADHRLRHGLAHACSRGLLDLTALGGSASRVTALRHRLADTPVPDPDVLGCRAHRELADELAHRAITLIRDRDGLLPLRVAADAELLVLEPTPRDLTPADTTRTVTPSLGEALRARLPGVRSVVYDDPPSDAEVVAVTQRARTAEVIVLATSAARLVPAQAALASAVLATGIPTVTVVQRSPHDLAVLPTAGTVLCSYGLHPPSTSALAEVLVGAAGAPGRLPIEVDGEHVPASGGRCP